MREGRRKEGRYGGEGDTPNVKRKAAADGWDAKRVSEAGAERKRLERATDGTYPENA